MGSLRTPLVFGSRADTPSLPGRPVGEAVVGTPPPTTFLDARHGRTFKEASMALLLLRMRWTSSVWQERSSRSRAR